ncbi:FitA-like ribbon-helix-helix domain-containing protein [Aeromicrobium sp.]|uniref:FitA-like ribbon-helix-helix domain-containing protein n=1 Tax=Aeromicrobium sp. TaxID=1871063 RepID=UPI0039E2756E
MTVITVSDLPPEIHQRLIAPATQHGRSVEAEAKDILEAGIASEHRGVVAALRQFAEESALTEDELSVMFPSRHTETQRPVN